MELSDRARLGVVCYGMKTTLSNALRTHLEKIQATENGYLAYSAIPKRSLDTLIKRRYVRTRTVNTGPDAGLLVVSVTEAGKTVLYYAERYARVQS